jgi:membrane protein YdbS with pleckstrin-like domain
VTGWSGPLLRVLRVPARPHLPAGDPHSARVFRAAPNYWRLRLVRWSVQQAATLAGFLIFAAVITAAPETLEVNRRGRTRRLPVAQAVAWVRGMEALAVAVWILQLPITLAVLRLDYELRWYVVTDRAARLREGVLRVTEMTFTLVNVQDIRIRQGPLQRLLGLADVELRTAGGGEARPGSSGQGQAHGHNLHLARFRGVENAEAIRDLVRERMKKSRDTGLGDPDEAAPEAETIPLETALGELLRESAALRQAAARASTS